VFIAGPWRISALALGGLCALSHYDQVRIAADYLRLRLPREAWHRWLGEDKTSGVRNQDPALLDPLMLAA
jgi:hypothetical protein